MQKVKVKVVKAQTINCTCKFGISILSSSLIFGCATAPPTQEMSDARQSVEAAENIGAEEHAPIALDSAQLLLSKAQDDMQAGEFEEAQIDALAAREAARQAVAISQAKQIPEEEPEVVAAATEPEPPMTISYTVKQYDSLWRIAAKESVYGEPLLWPLLLKANAESIADADLLSPGQILTIEIAPSASDKEAAMEFAGHRGSLPDKSQDASYLRQYGLR